MTITASLVNNTCFPSVAAAIDGYFSLMPVAHTAGTTSYKLEYLKINNVWNMRRSTISSGGTITVNFTVPVTAPTFPDCDPTEAYFDGMEMGWGVVGAMAAALSVIFIKQTFFR